ncbi:hypothetical protein HK104_001560 [Borealophlyctis nickersoniae]|nr:hypothetical protein HK104_001560 [Borealophlyctis nickersoniae]
MPDSSQCAAEEERSPTGHNILEGIANYTTRLTLPTLAPRPRAEALMFLIHFVGDIVQPLHVCGRARGGNDVHVRWGSGRRAVLDEDLRPITLHHVWDGLILEKDIHENFHGNVYAFKEWLVEEIGIVEIPLDVKETGSWAGEKHNWTSCIRNGPDRGVNVADWAWNCALDWAADSSELNCNKVWDPKYFGDNITEPSSNRIWQSTDVDLAGEYYELSKDIVRKQVAKGGYRMVRGKRMNLVGLTGVLSL